MEVADDSTTFPITPFAGQAEHFYPAETLRTDLPSGCLHSSFLPSHEIHDLLLLRLETVSPEKPLLPCYGVTVSIYKQSWNLESFHMFQCAKHLVVKDIACTED